MIVAAGALVLLGLGLFVAGIVTGTTSLYWLCVGACVAAGLLLVVARLRIGRGAGARTPAPPATGPSATAPGTTAPATTAPERTAPATTSPGTTAPSGRHPDRAPADAEDRAPAAAEESSSTAHAPPGAGASGPPSADEPPVEEVEVTDLLLVVDLHDEVLVVDEHPRYHVAGCAWLAGRATVPLPVDEARTDGFTPCGLCAPDRNLAERERGRRAGRDAS